MRPSKSKIGRTRSRARSKEGAPANASRRRQTRHPESSRKPSPANKRYSRLRSIDGRHPLKNAVPGAVVRYPAKRRRDSEIAFFNFNLAREIGLLPARHPDELDPALRRVLLDTFSLVIVNEWDEAHGNRPAARDRRTHSYMATRYLQLQHPDKRGLNSGDGRSIWNGLINGHAGSWDVSSCGTGVTRLCPATSEHGRFFRTGNSISDYGCGTAHIDEGIGAALMSEAFARNGIRTERVLGALDRVEHQREALAVPLLRSVARLQPPLRAQRLGRMGAKMLHNVIDRAIQVHGALGVTEDTPLEGMYRRARFARIYDGPDEVHVMTTARRILRSYQVGDGWDFGLR